MNVNKQGVLITERFSEFDDECPKIWNNINENLIKGNYSAMWQNDVRIVSGSAVITLTDQQIKSLVGTSFTFSYDLCRTNAGQKSTTEGIGWGENRFGCHLSLTYTDTNGSKKTIYPCISELQTIAVQRVSMASTFPTDYVTSNGFSVGLQPYAKPNDSSVWYIKNLKFELGESATPWCPHVDDYNDISSSSVNSAVSANNFYEI